MQLGTVLRAWRLHKEIDLRTAAKEMGTTAATLLRIEQGRAPGGKTLAQILHWLLR